MQCGSKGEKWHLGEAYERRSVSKAERRGAGQLWGLARARHIVLRGVWIQVQYVRISNAGPR